MTKYEVTMGDYNDVFDYMKILKQIHDYLFITQQTEYTKEPEHIITNTAFIIISVVGIIIPALMYLFLGGE